MKETTEISPWSILIPVGLGTSLSLFGDATLYVVLPTHTADAGVMLGSVGILLSANRFIRLVLNGPAGLAYARWPRRPLFILSLLIGAFSTAIYAISSGFWPLLVGRLIWGLAWAGIWVGGNAIILDMTNSKNRGRWVGIYQIYFFLGASSGFLLGGLLTDLLGYHKTMGIGAGLTFLGAIGAMIFLVETRDLRSAGAGNEDVISSEISLRKPVKRTEFASAMALLGVNRLVLSGVLNSTLSLFLLVQLGAGVRILDYSLGVATLAGLVLGLNTIIAMVISPIAGELSDRWGNRWSVAVGVLALGMAGFILIAMGSPLVLFIGLPLTAIAGGSNQGLATALVGDLGDKEHHSVHLGWLFTVGDLASAIGPTLAYALIPWLGLNGLYLMNAAVWGLMLILALKWSFKVRRQHSRLIQK